MFEKLRDRVGSFFALVGRVSLERGALSFGSLCYRDVGVWKLPYGSAK